MSELPQATITIHKDRVVGNSDPKLIMDNIYSIERAIPVADLETCFIYETELKSYIQELLSNKGVANVEETQKVIEKLEKRIEFLAKARS